MRQELILRCDCGDDHYLTVMRYPDDPDGYISLVDGTHCTSIRCRIKSAWKVLRKGSAPHFGVEVVLNPVTSRQLIEELERQWPSTQSPGSSSS